MNQWPIGTGALVAALSATAPAWAQPSGAPYGPGMMWPGHWYGMLLGPVMMILLVAAVVVLVVVALRWLGRAPRGSAGPTPLDVLRERFARGEIDKDEFEVRRRALSE